MHVSEKLNILRHNILESAPPSDSRSKHKQILILERHASNVHYNLRWPQIERTHDAWMLNIWGRGGDTITASRSGPNSSPYQCGKTMYLRQLGYIQIMAQIGSFVPAEFASVRIADQIFFHSGGSDDLATRESAFAKEVSTSAVLVVTVLTNTAFGCSKQALFDQWKIKCVNLLFHLNSTNSLRYE